LDGIGFVGVFNNKPYRASQNYAKKYSSPHRGEDKGEGENGVGELS
jgi:hypothetical protein